MFDDLRESFRQLSDRLDPDERRRMTSGMREALIHARLAIKDLQETRATTDAALAAERRELETVRRRQGYAADVGDTETVAIAERFAQQHADRVAVLESKRMVQDQELTLAEREYESMSAELRRIMSGVAPQASNPASDAAREVDALLSDDPLAAGAATDVPEPPVRRSRAEREADAESRLAEMKRRLGM
jgi:multidrug resistance efflux pump